MPTRRQALATLMLPIACAPRGRWAGPVAPAAGLPPPGRGPADEAARDEDYWARIAQAFTVDRAEINLNNGSLSPSPAIVQDAMARHLAEANSLPAAHAIWNVAPPLREAVRQRLAAQFGVDAEELAITRNAAEGLQICQLGIELSRGDEVLASTHDYPHMVATFRQRERRDGIVLRQIKLPVPAEDPARTLALYEQAITPRTKLILITHMINLTGQITPVREVVAMARKRGIPVIVDGAQSVGHIDFKISDLDCDYFASSLHKWMCAPHGTGILYVRRDKIRGLWPLMAAPAKLDDDIRKFEEVGTQPQANALAIAEALMFHQAIGGARKEARLLYLRERWTQRLLAAGDRVRMHTNLARSPRLSCSIVTVEIAGIDTMKLWAHLWDKHRILAGAIVHDEVVGLRISPSIYNTPAELDRFCEVIEQVIRRGLPA